MPGRDGTGPSGEGPLTGRRAGRCGGTDDIDELDSPFGRGLGRRRRRRGGGGGRGRGAGFGRREGARAAAAPEAGGANDARYAALEAEMQALKKRLDELKGD